MAAPLISCITKLTSHRLYYDSLVLSIYKLIEYAVIRIFSKKA